MKRITDYIDEALFNEEDLLVNEGFVADVANWLGNKKQQFTSMINDLSNFSKKVKLAAGGLSANLINDKDTLSEEERKEIMSNISSKKAGKEQIDYIKKVWNDHASEDNYKKSGFMTYALLYGKELAENESDMDSVKTFDQGIQSISSETKKMAKAARDKKAAERKGKNARKNPNPDKVEITAGDKVKKPEEVKSDIENKVSTDPLSNLTQTAGLDSKKLQDAITYLIYNDNKNKSTEDFDKLLTGLGAIVCGVKILSNDDKIDNGILKGWGINSIKDLVNAGLKSQE